MNTPEREPRIILTGQKSRETKRREERQSDSLWEERSHGESAPIRPVKHGNRWTVIGVWVLTALLAVAGCLLLWKGGYFGGTHFGFSKSLPALAGDVAQVEVLESGVVAVLRTDGTVDVAGNDAMAAKTASWEHIVKLFPGYDCIGGIRGDGTAVCTNWDLNGWTDIQALYFGTNGAAGLRTDGRVLTAGTWEKNYDPTGWTDIRELYLWDTLFGLKRDGTVILSTPWDEMGVTKWKDVQQLYPLEGHQLCGRLSDGNFVCTFGKADGLKDSVKIVSANGVVYGLTADGRVRTQTGELYRQDGDLWAEADPLYPAAFEKIDISRFRDLKDILASDGLIMLKKDGTVSSVNGWISWDFSTWTQIEKLYTDGCGSVYGLRKDGSVLVAKNWGEVQGKANLGQNVKELYVSSSGVVGLREDGKLVGEGVYTGSLLRTLNE